MAAAAKTSATIHAVLGSDEAEVKRAALELSVKLGPGGDFGSDIIDAGGADNADQAAQKIHQAIEALQTFAFFGGAKLVWLKNASFLADTVSGRSAAVVEALEKLAETLAGGLPEGTVFLLSAVDVDKRRTFYKTLQKLARVEVFDRIDSSKAGWEEQAVELSRECADGCGMQFEPQALQLFARLTGGDRRVINNELEKLAVYLGTGGRAVGVEDVRLLVPLSREGIIWELGNSISERDLRRSLELLEQLLFQGETAVTILLVVVFPTVRHLLLAKDLMTRHKLSKPQQAFFFGKTLERLPESATAHLPRKKDGGINAYALGLAALHAHRFQLDELLRAMNACEAANVQLVTSGLEPRLVLSQLLARILSPAGTVR